MRVEKEWYGVGGEGHPRSNTFHIAEEYGNHVKGLVLSAQLPLSPVEEETKGFFPLCKGVGLSRISAGTGRREGAYMW